MKPFKLYILAGFTLFCIALLFFLPPIPQANDYHNFADRRTMMGIPNFWNVVSNIPFIIIGIAGMVQTLKQKNEKPYPWLPYFFFFTGAFLTGLGSAYYHIYPSNETLIWDRIPMTITFMSFFAAIISQHLHKQAGNILLFPLILIGIGTVLYWYFGELKGSGDLRPYALVQFYPMIAIPLIAFLFPSPSFSRKALILVIIFYAFAKVLETTDEQIFGTSHFISGHSLKHLAAAGAVLQVFLMVRAGKPAREPVLAG